MWIRTKDKILLEVASCKQPDNRGQGRWKQVESIPSDLVSIQDEILWVAKELVNADILMAYSIDGDERATHSQEAISNYRKALRNYIKDGQVKGSRPSL